MMLFVMRQHVFIVPSSARQQHAVQDISIRDSLSCVYMHLICSCQLCIIRVASWVFLDIALMHFLLGFVLEISQTEIHILYRVGQLWVFRFIF